MCAYSGEAVGPFGGGIRVGAKFPRLRPPSLSRPFIYATLLFLSQQLLLRWHFQIRPAPTPDLLLFRGRRERTLNYRTSFKKKLKAKESAFLNDRSRRISIVPKCKRAFKNLPPPSRVFPSQENRPGLQEKRKRAKIYRQTFPPPPPPPLLLPLLPVSRAIRRRSKSTRRPPSSFSLSFLQKLFFFLGKGGNGNAFLSLIKEAVARIEHYSDGRILSQKLPFLLSSSPSFSEPAASALPIHFRNQNGGEKRGGGSLLG